MMRISKAQPLKLTTTVIMNVVFTNVYLKQIIFNTLM